MPCGGLPADAGLPVRHPHDAGRWRTGRCFAEATATRRCAPGCATAFAPKARCVRATSKTRAGPHKGWWDWKPAKRALEHLFLEGELTSIERQGFQKRYELIERFLPSDVDTSEPTINEHADHVIDRGLAAHGFATEKTLCHFRRDARVRSHVRQRLRERTAASDLAAHRTASGETIYTLPGALDRPARKLPDMVRILSPFDNVVIQRHRAQAVFDFDYTIECYTPEAKRQFGYFALPIVYRDDLVGRMDCKAHRTERRFEVKALFLERDVPEAFLPAFASALRDYAAFTGCDEVQVRQVSPRSAASAIKGLFG